ncbi:N-acyl-D-amino-acid deacylase family protein [Kordiimonas pumila]|uniref:Amidohydrolase family protein n=1 Tax=Kordiimonas pumila TaxID=2161677 RepID=A0ABV7D9N7_9PROT|nr:D-aminoacylase [Kordiimonas pumila]
MRSIIPSCIRICSIYGFALLGLAACGESQDRAPTPTSFLIENASVIDGTGSAAHRISVRVDGEQIIAVGDLNAMAGERIIDASGLVLAPGFIDTHNHHDWSMKEDPTLLPAVSQGITTIIVGQDGSSSVPISSMYAFLEKSPVALNYASYVGHNTVREQVMGDDNKRPATQAEIEQMADLVRRDITAGALGLSSGLEYDPGIYSSTGEVLTLAKAAASLGGRYISHMRSEDRAIWPAVEELIEIGRETGMPVQVSHIKLAMRSLWGKADDMIALLDAARAEGIDVTADIYPYDYWASSLEVLLPNRDFENRADFEFALSELVQPDDYYLIQFAPAPTLVGKSMGEIARARGEDPIDTYMALLKEVHAWEKANPESGMETEGVMGRSMRTDDVKKLMLWPHTNICSDGTYEGHPRGYGTYPRILGRFVRDEHVMPLEVAIHKMTGLAASHMGITDRGLIKEGYKADLVLFDADTIIDNATIAEATKLSTGIQNVWVNGTLVYNTGNATGEYPGQIIRYVP